MANQRPKTVRCAALELLRQGLSEREVLKALEARGMTCSRGSLQNWRKAADATAAPPLPRQAPTATSRAAPSVAPAPRTTTAEMDAELSDEDLLRLPVRELGRMMIKVRERFVQETESPEFDHTVLGALMPAQERLAKALVLARPPLQLDPDKDPSSLEARKYVYDKLGRLIAKEKGQASPKPT